jgi:hypothetical protein
MKRCPRSTSRTPTFLHLFDSSRESELGHATGSCRPREMFFARQGHKNLEMPEDRTRLSRFKPIIEGVCAETVL